MRLPPKTIAMACAAATALGGCGGDGDVEQVRAVVERFGAAGAAKDYQEICDDLLAASLVEKLERIGLPCEQALRQGLGTVSKPTLAIKTVAVRNDRALVGVRSGAANQKPSDDVIELVREADEWRIAALAKPQPQPPAPPGP